MEMIRWLNSIGIQKGGVKIRKGWRMTSRIGLIVGFLILFSGCTQFRPYHSIVYQCSFYNTTTGLHYEAIAYKKYLSIKRAQRECFIGAFHWDCYFRECIQHDVDHAFNADPDI